MIAFVAALLAGSIAAAIRWMLSRTVRAPWAVLVVNVVGSAIGGVVLALSQSHGLGADLRLIVLGGFCGGLTTFSTWSVETIQLVQDGKWRTAALSVGANLVLGIGAAAVAYLAVR